METKKYTILQYSERSILVTFSFNSSDSTVHFFGQLREKLISLYGESILEVNFAYNSLLINYVYAIDDVYSVKLAISKCINGLDAKSELDQRKIHLPVCYDISFGIDLEELSMNLKLSIPEIIQLHTSVNYLVCFLGFLPGFPYLNNLPKALHYPRHESPRSRIKKGSVGIGGSQTGIYPQDSPGGWQIIGNCPIDIFGNNWQYNALLKPTDILNFYAVSLQDFQRIKYDFKTGDFQLKMETIATT